MKKAISITLGGSVFTIEEDALQKLSSYFDSIKKYYGLDGEEILSDIEANIAEKFKATNKVNGVITITDVDEMIKIMGTVDQIENKEVADEKHSESNIKEKKLPKRLYRDQDNEILGGVCSGLAAYFSIDPVIIRLIFVALTLLNGVGILIYLIMWLIVPVAKTNVQKLEMQGEPINLNNLEEIVKEKSEQIKDQGKKAYASLRENKSALVKILNLPVVLAETFIKSIKSGVKIIFPILRIGIGLILAFFTLFGFVFASFWAVILLFKTNSPLLQTEFPISQISNTKAYFITILTAYFAILTPIIGVFIGAINLLSRKKIINLTIMVILFALFTINITITAIFGFDLANNIKTVYEQYIDENTIVKSIEMKDFNSISGNVHANVIIEKANEYAVSIRGLKKDVEGIEIMKEASTTNDLVNLEIRDNNPYGRHGFMVISKPVDINIKVPSLAQLDARNFLNYKFVGFETEPMVISREIKIVNESNGTEIRCAAGHSWCENSQECVMSIESCDSEINFSKTGVSAKELPGLNGEGLFLIYEEPGKPALRTELNFDGQSMCGYESKMYPCLAMSVSDYGLNNGRKIEVRGVEEGKTVRVRELIYNNLE